MNKLTCTVQTPFSLHAGYTFMGEPRKDREIQSLDCVNSKIAWNIIIIDKIRHSRHGQEIAKLARVYTRICSLDTVLQLFAAKQLSWRLSSTSCLTCSQIWETIGIPMATPTNLFTLLVRGIEHEG